MYFTSEYVIWNCILEFIPIVFLISLLMLNESSIFYLLLMVYLHKKYKGAILVGQLRGWPSPQRRLEILLSLVRYALVSMHFKVYLLSHIKLFNQSLQWEGNYIIWRVNITLLGNSGKPDVKLLSQNKNKCDSRESLGKSMENRAVFIE